MPCSTSSHFVVRVTGLLTACWPARAHTGVGTGRDKALAGAAVSLDCGQAVRQEEGLSGHSMVTALRPRIQTAE